jgi:hypothetical protein
VLCLLSTVCREACTMLVQHHLVEPPPPLLLTHTRPKHPNTSTPTPTLGCSTVTTCLWHHLERTVLFSKPTASSTPSQSSRSSILCSRGTTAPRVHLGPRQADATSTLVISRGVKRTLSRGCKLCEVRFLQGAPPMGSQVNP